MVVYTRPDISSGGGVASTQPRVAFIGLGNMGRGMAVNLVTKGKLEHDLTIYNRTKQRAIDLSDWLHADGARNRVYIADSIGDAVERADIIFTCLSDDKAVLQCFDVALQNSSLQGKVFAECSTIHPETGETLVRMVEGKGAYLVTAPVFGSPDRANAGQLVCVLAGHAGAVEKVRPFCEGVMGRSEIVFKDAPPSKALTLKMIGNTLTFNMIEATAEAHVLAEKSGALDSADVHSYIEKLFPGVYEDYSARMVGGDYWTRDEPAFSTDLARKDAAHAKKLAQDCGTSLETLEVADGHLARVRELKGEKADYVGIYGLLREQAGLGYENGACGWIM